MSEPPTLGELLRRLEDVARQISILAIEIREDRLKAEKTFVRRETYEAHREADKQDVSDIRSELATNASFRRQVLLAAGIGLIGWLLTLGIAISNFIAR